MLDNLGLGEFVFLALLALIFFGPERLPQIGARLGRWIRSLTQYSSAFLNEWRDEALVVRDAVQEVKGIRDEIAAARAEIAGALETARTDVDDAVSGARLDVQQQIQRSTQALPDTTAVEEQSERESAKPDDDAASAKTQEVLDGLLAKDTSPTESSPPVTPQPPAPLPQAARHPLTDPIQSADIERLRDQVTSLQAEMRALRESMAQIRAAIQSRSGKRVFSQGSEGLLPPSRGREPDTPVMEGIHKKVDDAEQALPSATPSQADPETTLVGEPA